MTSLEIVGTGIEMGKQSPLGKVEVVSGSVQGARGGAHNGTTEHARCGLCVGDSERLHHGVHGARLHHVEVELNLHANATHPITAQIHPQSARLGVTGGALCDSGQGFACRRGPRPTWKVKK